MEKKILFCDQAKTLMMILVIATHSMAFYWGNWFTVMTPAQEAPILAFISREMATVNIYVFTFVSGYLFQFIKFEKGKYKIFTDFVKKKAVRLMVPYVFLAAFWCVPFQVYFYHASAAEIFNNYVLGYAPAQLWYLLMLFLLFVIVYPLADKIQSLKLYQVAALTFISYLFGMGLYFFHAPLNLPAAFVHLAFFVMGMVYRKNNPQLAAWYKFALPHFILFSIGYYLSFEHSTSIKIIRYVIDFFTITAGIFMAVALIQKFQDAEIWSKPLYNFFKENSLTMYLVHQQIIYCSIATFNGIVPPGGLALINFAAAISICAIICAIFNRFKVTRFLIGKS